MSGPMRTGDPRKLVTTAVALGAVLLVAWVMVLSQKESAESGGNAYEQARIDSLRNALGRETALPDATPDAGPDSTFYVFVLLAGGLTAAWWFFGRKNAQGTVHSARPPFPVKLEQDLGSGQRLLVLEAGPEFWVLSLSATTSTLLARLNREDAAWLETLSSEAPPALTFAAVLKNLTGGAPR